MESMLDVAVIGAGGAGTMAHLRAVLNGDRSVLFSGDADSKRKGRATWVAEVDNMPGMHGLKRPITSSTGSTLKWLEAQPELAGAHEHVKAKVTSLTQVEGGFELGFSRKGEARTRRARFVVVATGVMDVQPEIGGSIAPILPFANRYDVLYCIRCDGHKTIGKRLSVIGDRDSAIGIAAMMVERYGHERVDVLTSGRPASFSERSLELAAAYGMTIHEQAIASVEGDAKGEGLSGYTLADGTRIESTVSIVALGIIAYNELLTGLGAEIDENGRALVSDRFESSVPGLFVVGDLVPGRKMQIYTAWDEAVDAADEINRRLRLERRAARLAAFRAG